MGAGFGHRLFDDERTAGAMLPGPGLDLKGTLSRCLGSPGLPCESHPLGR